MINIPCRTDAPSYTFEISLDQIEYRFEFRWSTRESAWYFDLYTSEDDLPVVLGTKVVLRWPLAWHYSNIKSPPGMLIAIDTQGTDTAPGLYDLGSRVQMVYQEVVDL